MRYDTAILLACLALSVVPSPPAGAAEPPARVLVRSLPGWPVFFARPPLSTATVAVVDLQGTRAVSYSGSGGAIHLLDAEGQDLPGWPIDVFGGVSSCMADLDGDGQVEIFKGGTTKEPRRVYFGFRLDGSTLPGWPVTATDLFPVSVTSPCTIGDLDGDGTIEIVGGTELGEILVWSQDGELLPGWPIVFPLEEGLGVPSVSGTSIGDLDGDGSLEICVVAGSGLVHVLRYDGTELPGFPINLGMRGLGPPALADVDGDGQLEIVVALLGSPGVPRPSLFVLRANGAVQPGFPRLVEDRMWFGAVVADLDRNGELWIVAAVDSTEETLMAWNARTGEPREGFPVPNPVMGVRGVITAPTVGDITGDGFPDIVLTRFFDNGGGAMMFAWERDGTAIEPHPLYVFPGFLVTATDPTLTDLNDDGLIDTLPGEDSLGSGRLHALTFNQPYDPRTLEWPTRSHDARHTGLYEPPVDELRIWGQFNQANLVLANPPGQITAKLTYLDMRRELAGLLTAGGVRIAKINDRPVANLVGKIEAVPGLKGMGAPRRRPDLVVKFDGQEVAAAILQRLLRAGVSEGDEREVRLKLESPLQEGRRVGGELRLRVRMPAAGD